MTVLMSWVRGWIIETWVALAWNIGIQGWTYLPNIADRLNVITAWTRFCDLLTWNTGSLVVSCHFLPVSLHTAAGCIVVFAPQGLVWVTVLIESGLFQLAQSGRRHCTQYCNCRGCVRKRPAPMFRGNLRRFLGAFVPFAVCKSNVPSTLGHHVRLNRNILKSSC